MPVCLYLLDEPHVQVEGRRFELNPAKPSFLLIYLAVRGEWVSRDALGALLWPDNSDEEARHNVRVNLHRAKNLPWVEGLEVERERIRWLIETDVSHFRAALGQADWKKAVWVHRRPFLESFLLQDTPALEEWASLERESLLEAWRNAALRHSEELQQDGQHAEAATVLAELLRQDLLAEDILQSYLRVAYLSGQREAALKLYERFAQELDQELGLEPMQETVELAQTLRRSQPLKATTEKPQTRIPLEVLKPPRLVGREHQQARLESAQIALVSGEPGVGKTRLLQEVFLDAPLIRCREGLENLPFYPVLEYLKAHLDTLSDLGPYREDLARLLPEVWPGFTPPPAEPLTAKSRLLEAFARAFAHIEQLIFDDLQWADEGTLELFLYLANQNKRLMATYRTHEVGASLGKTIEALRSKGIEEIALQPLDPGSVQTLLADLIGTSEGPQLFSGWLHEKTGGNPFFALETLKALFENGVLRAEGGEWHTDLDEITQDYSELKVPPKVAEVVRRRVGRLSESAQRVVQAASVVGQHFSPKLLASVVGLSEWAVVDGVEEAQQGGLLSAKGFVHDLVRQSVYSAIQGARCKMLHAQVAQALGSGAEAATLAEHWFRADEPEKAQELWLEAAHNYRHKGMHSQALLVLQRMPDHLEAKLLQAEVLGDLGHFAEALSVVEQIGSAEQSLLQQARIANIRAEAQIALGQIGEAEKTIQTLRPLVEQLGRTIDPRPFWLTASKVAHYLGRSQTVRDLLTPLVGEATKDVLQAMILTSLGASYDELGDPERAWPLHQQALSLARSLGAKHVQVDTCLNLLWSATALSRVRDDPRPTQEALKLGEEALKLGEYGGSEVLRNNLAYAYMDVEDHPAACQHYEWLAWRGSDPSVRCIAWARLAALYARLGRGAEAQTALTQAIAAVNQTDLYIAHVRVLITALNLGSEAQVQQMMPYLREQTIEPWLQEELDQALSARGLRR